MRVFGCAIFFLPKWHFLRRSLIFSETGQVHTNLKFLRTWLRQKMSGLCKKFKFRQDQKCGPPKTTGAPDPSRRLQDGIPRCQNPLSSPSAHTTTQKLHKCGLQIVVVVCHKTLSYSWPCIKPNGVPEYFQNNQNMDCTSTRPEGYIILNFKTFVIS